MTVEPLIALAGDTGINILDLNVQCPTVDVTGPTPPPVPPAPGGGIALLLGLVVLGVVMTSKK